MRKLFGLAIEWLKLPLTKVDRLQEKIWVGIQGKQALLGLWEFAKRERACGSKDILDKGLILCIGIEP